MNSTEVIPEQAVWEPEYEKLEWSECLKTLDEKYRLVLLLYYMEDFNAREIAQLLEMNEKTVQTRLKRGREKLTEQYHFQERGVSI